MNKTALITKYLPAKRHAPSLAHKFGKQSLFDNPPAYVIPSFACHTLISA